MIKLGLATKDGSVHPHGRGDNLAFDVQFVLHNGSPPRAWGQSPDGSAVGDGRRFTPTGVGTMPSQKAAWRPPSVHPHGRGDNALAESGLAAAVGSPPRAWGQSQRRSGAVAPLRFTPTGVGTIMARRRLRSARPVHPHGRGDNSAITSRTLASSGSPPRAWGQY